METEILKYILTSHGSVDREELECNLGDASLIADIIRNNNDKFVACSFNGTWKVVVRTGVRLCRVKECQREDCEGLHLCKNLLLSGDCQFQQSRRGCSFSHDLKSENNLEVLRRFGLETLKRTEVCLLLLQSDNTLLPQICHDYNNRSVCQDECPRLHICERFLCQDCYCHRPHGFSDPRTWKLLRDKHIPEQLLGVLKSVYANKQALWWADRGNRSRENGSEATYSSEVNEYEAEDDSGPDDQKSTEETPTDWTAYDSDSSSSVSTNPSEGSRHGDLREREGRRRDRRRGNRQNTPSAAGNVEPDSRYRQSDRSDTKRDGQQSHGGKGKTEICMFYIRGKCRDEGNCQKAHDKMPYRWKIKRINGLWDTMADNEKIEREYCDPQNTYSTTCPPVHFDTMMSGNNEVRRLSTLNSVVKPHYTHTTEWLWYFEDVNGQWKQYSDAYLFDVSEQRLIIITSQKLEEMYRTNKEDVVAFFSASQPFKLSFKSMRQTNINCRTKWLVRRRPRFVSAAEVETKR